MAETGDLTWFKFRRSWIEVFKTLSKEETDRLLDAIDSFNNDKECPELIGRESIAWILIRNDLENDKNARRKAADAHKEAGKSGGRPKTKMDTDNENEYKETKETNLVSEKPNDIKNNQINQNAQEIRDKSKEIRDKSKEKDFICADAQSVLLPFSSQTKQTAKIEKPKLTPDDDSFWNVFKNKKNLAIAFYKATGLYPMSKEFGHWQKDLDQFVEAGIGVDVMIQAIEKIQAEGKIQYKSPGSVLSTARWIMANKISPVTKSPDVSDMTPDEIMANGNLFSSAAEMLRALQAAKQRQAEIIDL